MTTRTACLAAAALALSLAGCSHNPGYFPYYSLGGRIEQNHAKPGGSGYFKNFDPKACKLEITPNQTITAPLGTQVVLVGSVLDKDGQPRRSRRIEWIVDGPGSIVEADESGTFAGRGYKVDNKYAVTHTNYVTKTITRGNTDAGDDVIIAPGQTFCVISSAVPGETVVTGYAPEVFNWNNGRVVVRITWGDSRYSFPAPAVVRSGGEHALTTTVSASGTDGVPSGYRIRYKVLEGPPAVLVGRGTPGTSVSASGGGTNEAEATTDANGEATVRLVETSAKAGKSRVAIEIVKPPESGTGPGTVVSRRETIVEWAEPSVHLGVNAPTSAGVGASFPVTIGLDNEGAVDSRDARVKVTLSDGATLERSDPPPSRQDANGALTFDVPPVSGRGKQQVVLQVKPARLGQVTVSAEVATADGLTASNAATTRVEQGKIQLRVEGPGTAVAGAEVPFKVAVTNGGSVTAENVTVWARYDDGLRYAAPTNPVELAAGTLAPGQTKTLDLPLTASKAGKFGVRANATADGGLTAASEPVSVDVQRAELSVTATGPRLVYLNQDFEWTVTVKNAGDATLSNVVVRAALPAEVRAKAVEGTKAGANSVEWAVAELRGGEQRTYRVPATANRLNDRATLSASATGDVRAAGGKAGGEPVTAKGESTVALIGTPAVSMVVVAPQGLVEVGKRTTFKVLVKNEGTVSARGIELTGFAPAELRPVRGSGAVGGAPAPAPLAARIEGTGRLVFPPLEELRPGETVTFTIDLDAVHAGDARFRAEVAAAHLTGALKEEQAARVTAK